jgi:hypothetical protein
VGLEDEEWLPRQRLRHLLCALVGFRAEGRRVAHERMFA